MHLIFIHGAGCTGDVFDAQVSAFPGAIAPTLPGHTTPGSPASIGEFADAVTAGLDARGLDSVVLCGHSMGAAIALELALRHDKRIKGIALLGGGARLRVRPATFESIERDFAAAAHTLAEAFFSDPTAARVEGAVAGLLSVGADQTLRDFRSCDAFDVSDRLGEIRLPVLALTGEHDVMTPPKYATFLADRIPGAAARILPGAGHLCMIERPAETNEALLTFVNQFENSPV